MKSYSAFFLFFVAILCYAQSDSTKINGANLVAPPSQSFSNLDALKNTNTAWVSIIPYAFIKKGATKVYFDTEFQWWGERSKGVEETIKQAKSLGFRTMIKPHIWVSGDGWAGDFKPNSDQEWLQWEQTYTEYILNFCKIAAKYDVEIFCMGTELRQIVKERPAYWLGLIQKIRTIYNGKLTYAANWDNYQNIEFWQELDYIGIDSYFPLSKKRTPSIDDLKESWKPIHKKLKEFSNCNSTPILFTEFGYTCTEYCTLTPWKENDSYSSNQQAQLNAYSALFSSFWEEGNWFKGGFFWKWHINNNTKRNYKTSYTPQGKKVLNVIQKWYKK